MAVGLIACLALYVWLQSRIPERANIASIKRRYGKQLDKLAEYAHDYKHIYEIDRPDSEKIKRLFADPAIVEVAVYGSNSVNKGGVGVKPGKSERVGTWCLHRIPSIGKPVVNLWSGGGRQFIEYSASVADREGVERSYTIIFDLSKMEGADH